MASRRRPAWIGRTDAKPLRRFLRPLRKLDLDGVILELDPDVDADGALDLATRLLATGDAMACTSLVPVAVRVAAAAVHFGGDHLTTQLHSLDWAASSPAHRLYALALWILAQPFARDDDPVLGELDDEKRDVATMAWLTLYAPVHINCGGLGHELARQVLKRTELDPASWIPERVPRLAANYERTTYGK